MKLRGDAGVSLRFLEGGRCKLQEYVAELTVKAMSVTLFGDDRDCHITCLICFALENTDVSESRAFIDEVIGIRRV